MRLDWKRTFYSLWKRVLAHRHQDPYDTNVDKGLSDEIQESAKAIRGLERPPALIVHGVMPRSGTVYIGELLRLHPDIAAYPNDLWEVPLLGLAGEVETLQKHFLQRYRENTGKLGDHDFLALMGSAFIAHLYMQVPKDKRILLKVPDVRYLARFPLMFPHEDLLVLIRDGRDVVSSTLKTWPEHDFGEASIRWRNGARLIMEFDRTNTNERYWLAKYEQILEKPEVFISEACRRYGLDPSRYPFERIAEIPARGSSSLQSAGRVDWNPVAAPRNFRPTAHWKTWPAAQKQEFKKVAGNTLIETGYCKDLNW